MRRAIFLDREGTITVGVPRYERVDAIDKVELLPNAIAGLKKLATLDYDFFIVTNQAGISEGLISMGEFNEINDKMLKLIAPSGIQIKKTYVCPHGEHEDCACRKPEPKLLFDAAKEYDIDLANSWMIGDRPSDVMTGVHAGTKTILVLSGVPTVESDQATVTVPSILEAADYIVEHTS